MTTLDNYPMGALEHLTMNHYLLRVKVEVGVELGLFVDVEVIDEDDIKGAVEEAIYNRFKSKDVEINNIEIYQHDLFSKSE